MSESRSLTVAERLSAIPAFALTEQECLEALAASVYPGAKPQSIKMALAYCKANLLDPFQKPVHIVPMTVKVKDAQGNEKSEKRDIIMPGSGLYRTQAARTGGYIGISEPEFGPMERLTYASTRMEDRGEKWADTGNTKLTKVACEATLQHPEWCRVTVKRLVQGHVAEFVAIEYWLENYATAGNDTDAPNAMWAKRPRGQLAKCAEAQALRKAFPEVGAAPTAEEMEGKSLEPSDLPAAINPEVVAERQRPQSKTEQARAGAVDIDPETGEITPRKTDAPAATATNGNGEAKASPPASAGMLKLIRSKAAAKEISEADLCTRAGITTLDGITIAEGNALLKDL